MAKYIIWDEKSDVITPSGDFFTAAEWLDRYPMAKSANVDLVMAGDSAVNGAFCQEYTSFVNIYRQQGCDFTGCETKQDHLDRIEQFEIEREEAARKAAEEYVSPEERLAAATEAQVLIALDNESNNRQ